MAPPNWDIFISHASEDKKDVASPLAHLLNSAGLRVWLDEAQLTLGDSLRSKIDEGLAQSRFGVVILSPAFFSKKWPESELSALWAREKADTKVILPVWHQMSRADIAAHSPLLADKLGISTSEGLQRVTDEILRAVESGKASLDKSIWPDTLPSTQSFGIPSDPDSAFNSASAANVRDSLTIIIPAFNESNILKDLIKGLRAEGILDQYKVIICDDGSKDNSFEIMQKHAKVIKNLHCIKNSFNTRKVGAIDRMARLAGTPFVLTLDADCTLSELKQNALAELMVKMMKEGYSASFFRIIPNANNWLGRLQKLDYSLFTDAIRRILGVPLCLIGQGVLWRTDSLLEVLSQHSGEFDGDDLENTIIAMNKKMRIYWERNTVVILSNPKPTIIGLVKQRALSWDFGLLRVLFSKKALRLGGESGAFYKNLLLMDVFAHPFRIMAVPVLLSVPIWILFGSPFYRGTMGDLYRNAFLLTMRYGVLSMFAVWFISVVNSFVCTRRLRSTAKWAVFNAVYLSSPFVYILFYPEFRRTYLNAYDALGAAIQWMGLGLFITYIWWSFLAFGLLCITSLELKAKRELLWSVPLVPLYYFILLVVCKTVGILKFISHCLLRR